MKIEGAERIFFLQKLPHPGLGMAVSSFVLPITEDLHRYNVAVSLVHFIHTSKNL